MDDVYGLSISLAVANAKFFVRIAVSSSSSPVLTNDVIS